MSRRKAGFGLTVRSDGAAFALYAGAVLLGALAAHRVRPTGFSASLGALLGLGAAGLLVGVKR